MSLQRALKLGLRIPLRRWIASTERTMASDRDGSLTPLDLSRISLRTAIVAATFPSLAANSSSAAAKARVSANRLPRNALK